MKAKDSTIILLGITQLLPLVAVLSSTIIIVLGISYAFLLWRFWSSTRTGRRFFRAWWRATLRMEKFLLGENAEC